MKRVAFLLLVLAACGRDQPKLTAPTTTTTFALVAPDTSSPPSTLVVTTTAGRTTTSARLLPADAATPAAGGCGNAPEGGAAEITLNPDVPSPRCVIVHSLNMIKVINNTSTAQTVSTGYDSATVQPHGSHLFPQHVGDYWAVGVHRLNTGSLYAGSGPEVWLQQS